jgi:hypothetical protein
MRSFKGDVQVVGSMKAVFADFVFFIKFIGEGGRSDDAIVMEPLKKMFRKGLTNTSKGIISGQTHPRNNKLLFDNDKRKSCLLILGSDERLNFGRVSDEHQYLLREVLKPSRMKFKYNYEDNLLRKIELRNRAALYA